MNVNTQLYIYTNAMSNFNFVVLSLFLVSLSLFLKKSTHFHVINVRIAIMTVSFTCCK